MFKFFDSHSHLQFSAYDTDRDEVVRTMRTNSVGTIIVGTNFNTSAAAVSLSDELGDNFYSAVAVHPAHVFAPHHDKNEQVQPPTPEMFDPEVFSKLFLKSKKIVAVGECGLDYFRLKDDPSFGEIRERQIKNFLGQIAFAKKNNLPLIVHSRDAHADTLAIMKDSTAGIAGAVMHCFSGTIAEAKEYLELGFYISITCAVTYGPRKGESENPLAGVAAYVPLDRLLVETDSPYLSPADRRGRRNEPTNVIFAVKKIAELRKTDADQIARATSENVVKLFLLASSILS